MTVRDRDFDGSRSEETGTPHDATTETAAGEPLTRVFNNPVPDWDRYTIVDSLGEGAMGLVYRAVDPSLGRQVAIKFINSDDPDRKNRFQREARAHAQIEHDHVCRVYEVGEVGGRAYIAMQLIDGRSLQDAASDLTLEQRVVVMEQIAEAVQAAHSMGVIHRDIKPGNIMVENRDGGGLHAYVLDFGIAREVGSPGMTLTGMVVGTPAYMAPEQVQGDPGLIDRRVDVYGIGATLYDLIAGEAPFSGTTRIETLVKVVSDEPRPLRELDGRVPADLETIVSTCLEKDPQRRYASARALAEDLQHYLDGEPIAARPASRVYRLGKYMRKHRALTAVVGVAVAIVLTLSAALVGQHFHARRQQAAAQRFGQELERIEGVLRHVHMLPLHDVAPTEEMIRRRMATIEESILEMGNVGVGPGAYALGAGHLFLGEPENARDRLQTAWDSGYRSPELAGALGHALGEMYLEAADAAERIRNSELRAARKQELDETLRQPALDFLGRGHVVSEEAELHHGAMLALLEGRFEDALEEARSSYERHPWRYESMRLEAEILVSRGKDLEEHGQIEASRADYLAAGEVYSRALEIGRSDADLYRGEAARLVRLFNLEQENGTLREDLFAEALETTDAADIARPGDPRPANLRSKLYWMRGDFELHHGRNPTASLEEAARLAERAAELAPEDPQAPINLGMIYRLAGTYARRQGKDPRPLFGSAIAACERAITIDPDSVVAWLNLGTAEYLVAEYELASGLDPIGSLEKAAEAYGESIRVRPTFAAHSNSGLVHWQRAEYQQSHGQDPADSLDAAANCFARAIELNPSQASVFSNRGLILLERAELEAERGGDPTPWLKRSLAVLERAVDLMPDLAAAHNNLGNAHKTQAVVEMNSGNDPRPSLERAVTAYGRAIELDPNLAYQYSNLGYAWELRAEFEILVDGDPFPALREARAQLRHSLTLDPTMAFAHHNLALCSHTEARYLVDHDRDPTAILERGRREARAAVAGNHELWDLQLMEGQLNLISVEWAMEHGGPVEFFLTDAGRRLAAAEELNPTAPGIYLQRAREAILRAHWQRSHDVDPTEALSTGLFATDRGLAIDPTDADFFLIRGRLYLLEARTAEEASSRHEAVERAVVALETAENFNPLYEKTCRPLIAEARRLQDEMTG